MSTLDAVNGGAELLSHAVSKTESVNANKMVVRSFIKKRQLALVIRNQWNVVNKVVDGMRSAKQGVKFCVLVDEQNGGRMIHTVIWSVGFLFRKINAECARQGLNVLNFPGNA